MKDIHVLYAAGIVALIAITGVFIGYATETLPQHQQRVITIAPPVTDTLRTVPTATAEDTSDTSIAKEKDCYCCKESMVRLGEAIEKIRKREQAAKTKSQTNTPNWHTQE